MWKVLKVHRKEFGLHNTLVNGQCFNWKKIGEDQYQGILGAYFVKVKREGAKADEEILY